MTRDDVIRNVEAKLDELGVSPNVRRVVKIPSSVEIEFIVGDQKVRAKMRSGIRADQLQAELARLSAEVEHRRATIGTIDIEQAIAAKVAAE